jgi:hypothetical protein
VEIEGRGRIDCYDDLMFDIQSKPNIILCDNKGMEVEGKTFKRRDLTQWRSPGAITTIT